MPTDNQPRKIKVAAISVFSNTALVVLKLIVGLMTGSISIISEAIHSGVDLLAAVIALVSVKTSSLPADRKHPFGHGKVENISGTIEALLIFFAAVWIIYEAVHKIRNPGPLDALEWGIGVMLFSTAVNIVVSEMLFKVGRDTDSIALQADAWHLRTDIYTSAGVMFSLAAIRVLEWAMPGRDFFWIDPAAAIIVALLIIKAAWNLTIQSGRDLMDVNLPKDEERWIMEMIQTHRPSVHGFHHFRTRKAGHFRFVEFHLKVDPKMTVFASHEITEDLSGHIKSKFPYTSVNIHIEPCDGNCEGKCLEGCLLTEKEREQILAASDTPH
jgi:cation diffusion facilitator family transporter